MILSSTAKSISARTWYRRVSEQLVLGQNNKRFLSSSSSRTVDVRGRFLSSNAALIQQQDEEEEEDYVQRQQKQQQQVPLVERTTAATKSISSRHRPRLEALRKQLRSESSPATPTDFVINEPEEDNDEVEDKETTSITINGTIGINGITEGTIDGYIW